MTGLVKIIQSVSAANSATFTEFLQAAEEGQSFRNSSSPSDGVVQHLTSLLNKASTRESGLLLLEVFLKQCTLETLSQKGPLWGSLCIKSCYGKSAAASSGRAYDCLALLASKSKDVPELSKAFIGNLLPKVSETLSMVADDSHLPALKCVEECLQVFPGSSTPLRNSVEKYLLSFLDSVDPKLVVASGRCLHFLQEIKGGRNKDLNTKTAWQEHQFRLLGSLHDVLDIIYANFPETFDEEVETERLKINPLDVGSEPVQRSTQCLVRLKNLISYLIVTLKEPYSAPKMIAPKKILNLIARGLAINCIMAEQNPISDNLAVSALLPEVHVHLLKLADVLILTLKSHMALWAKTILRFVTDTLKWTFVGKSDGFPKPYRHLRIAAYNTLRLWCTVMRCGSLCEVVAETIIEQIKSDITPFQAEVTLQVLSGSKKHMSKKARRQLHKAQNERSNMAQTHSKSFNPSNTRKILSDEGNGELCAAALQCFKQVIQSASIFIKPTVVKDIQETVFALCAELSGNSCFKDKLYWSSICRKSLYEVVYSLVAFPHYLCPPPGSLAVGLLRIGQFSDPSAEVRDLCSELLSAVEKIIHPQKECLFFPSNAEEIKNAFKKYNRKRSANHLEELDESSEEEEDESLTEKDHSPMETEENAGDPTEEIIEGSVLDSQKSQSYSLEHNDLPLNEKVENISGQTDSADFKEQLNNREKQDDNTSDHAPTDDRTDVQPGPVFKEVLTKVDALSEEPAPKKICLEDESNFPIEVDDVEDAEPSQKPLEDAEPSEKPSKCTETSEKLSTDANPDDEMLLESITSAFVNELNEGSNE